MTTEFVLKVTMVSENYIHFVASIISALQIAVLINLKVLEDSSSVPTALTYRKIRQRCYGLLFNTFQTYCQKNSSVKCSKSILIKEWCAYQGNFMEQPECVEPLPLKYREALETEIFSSPTKPWKFSSRVSLPSSPNAFKNSCIQEGTNQACPKGKEDMLNAHIICHDVG